MTSFFAKYIHLFWGPLLPGQCPPAITLIFDLLIPKSN